jgi:ribosomal protein L9
VDSRTLSGRLNVAIVHENQAEKKVYGGVGSKNIQKEIRTEMAFLEQQGVKGQICPSAINI